MSTKAAGLFETLELLNDVREHRCEHVVKVEEDVTHEPGILTREVKISLEIPTADVTIDFAGSLPFVYVLRAVPRDKLWSVANCEVSAPGGARVLSHQEHVAYSSNLILARFWSVCGLWVLADTKHNAGQAEKVVQELIRIPALPPGEAKRLLSEHFDGDGVLKILRGQAVDPNLSARLFHLCSTLTTHYLVGIAFNANCGEFVTIEYSLEDVLPDVDSNFDERPTRKARWRMVLGAVPVQIHFHAPLVRVCDSYEMRLRTLEDGYVHSQSVLRATTVDGRRRYITLDEGERRPKTWRRAVGSSTGHIYVANGTTADSKVFIGIKVFERLPGSLGRSTLIAIGSLCAAVALTVVRWITGGGLDERTTALGVALLSLLTFAADAIASERKSRLVVVGARLSQLATALLLFAFALWLSVPSSAMSGGCSWQSRSTDIFIGWGWLPILALMVLNGRWIYQRLRRSYKTYLAAVPANPT